MTLDGNFHNLLMYQLGRGRAVLDDEQVADEEGIALDTESMCSLRSLPYKRPGWMNCKDNFRAGAELVHLEPPEWSSCCFMCNDCRITLSTVLFQTGRYRTWCYAKADRYIEMSANTEKTPRTTKHRNKNRLRCKMSYASHSSSLVHPFRLTQYIPFPLHSSILVSSLVTNEKTGACGKGEVCDAWTEQVHEPHLNNPHIHFKTLTHLHPLYVHGASSSGFSRY